MQHSEQDEILKSRRLSLYLAYVFRLQLQAVLGH